MVIVVECEVVGWVEWWVWYYYEVYCWCVECGYLGCVWCECLVVECVIYIVVDCCEYGWLFVVFQQWQCLCDVVGGFQCVVFG